MSKLEKLVVLGLLIAFVQLIFGYLPYAIFTLLGMIIVLLVGIIEYLRMR